MKHDSYNLFQQCILNMTITRNVSSAETKKIIIYIYRYVYKYRINDILSKYIQKIFKKDILNGFLDPPNNMSNNVNIISGTFTL